MATGSTRESNYIRGFDGIRAVAVLIVIAGHGNITGPLLRESFPAVFSLVAASRGVDIFFVLSGFLITTLLLGEQDRNGGIDLRNFFIRRAFRILPLYYLYSTALILLSLTVATGFRWEGLPYLLLNIFNFVPSEYRTAITGHIWSLSIEWHFYLVWPLIFVALFVRSRFLPIAALFFLLVACILTVKYAPRQGAYNYLGWTIPAAAPIIVGALAAMLLNGRRVCPVWFLPTGLLIYAWPALEPLPLSGGTVRATGIALCVTWIYCNQKSTVVSLLEFRPLRFTGMISYGLYVWHVFFMGTGPARLPGQIWPPDQLTGFVLTLIVAPLSFYYFERPVQALQKKLLRKKGPPENASDKDFQTQSA